MSLKRLLRVASALATALLGLVLLGISVHSSPKPSPPSRLLSNPPCDGPMREGRTTAAGNQAAYFDDSGEDIRLGNSYYEVHFRKSNGSIDHIIDHATGLSVSLGSRGECLWVAVYSDTTQKKLAHVGGCHYNAQWPNDYFTYTWSAPAGTLAMSYTSTGPTPQRPTAQVIVSASDSAWFDMQLDLQNNWAYTFTDVSLPSDLVFAEADIEEVLLPILPGVVLEPGFFDQNRGYTAKYPGDPGMFADYVALSSGRGRIAIYSLYGSGPIRPGDFGLVHDEVYISDTTFYRHAFGTWIGEGQTWPSPWVRIHVSQPPTETIAAYRDANGLGALPPLREKLGSHYTQTARSPIFKADAHHLGISFTHYYSEALCHIPTPGILHPVAFQPRGHDENYPDFLPPDAEWGSTAEFADMIQQAQAEGFLVMPYVNPTWWDDESPTLSTIAITDVAVLDEGGRPVTEAYGSEFQHHGYVMSPWAPFVQQRLQQLVVSMTEDVPSDMLLEDQIGARPWLFDHNPSSPHPMAYSEGWLEHAQRYSDTLLMTELGFDRLAGTMVGFHGSVLLPQHKACRVTTCTDEWWGDGNWHPYPLVPAMVRDKVLLYQHDLATQTMTADKVTLTWNLAFGYMLSYDLGYGGGLDNPWLELASVFQREVLARYADELVTDFAYLEDDVTLTSFETYSVVANWDEANPYSFGGHTLTPLGVLVTNTDGTLTAGVFTGYNGVPLSVGEHYLIEERSPTDITVYQPSGADTSLTLQPLPSWGPHDSIQARAYSTGGEVITTTPVATTTQGIAFVYQREVDAQPVAYYKVGRSPRVFLPLVLRGTSG